MSRTTCAVRARPLDEPLDLGGAHLAPAVGPREAGHHGQVVADPPAHRGEPVVELVGRGEPRGREQARHLVEDAEVLGAPPRRRGRGRPAPPPTRRRASSAATWVATVVRPGAPGGSPHRHDTAAVAPGRSLEGGQGGVEDVRAGVARRPRPSTPPRAGRPARRHPPRSRCRGAGRARGRRRRGTRARSSPRGARRGAAGARRRPGRARARRGTPRRRRPGRWRRTRGGRRRRHTA